MGFWSGSGSALLGTSGGFAGQLLSNYFNRKSSRDSSRVSLAHDLDYLDQVYPKQQELDYSLAGRYAQNSAVWDVQGLKNAGLNPILAAQGGFSGGSSYSSPSSNGSNFVTDTARGDYLEGIRDVASARQADSSADLADVQTDVAKGQADSLVSSAKSDSALKAKNVEIADATKRKIDAEVQQVNANTAKVLTDAINARENGGNPNTGGLISRVISALTPRGHQSVDVYNLLHDTLGITSSSRSSSRDNKSDLIEINTGKRKADAEHQLQQIMRDYYRSHGHYPE